ncbi:FIG00873229: hypothetical protein [uncultured Synechococcales cyanobacterium]|uniref:Transglutaminase-like domain-containing protein n=1 Tax=uncultured Synechococcales cyanobacterium TaxID=1936017 RepID=A0A6J4VTA4_9CYAN|nr:FIG00873229: hypothetical protein [uncultured Synechococcales cyanobacterium]
MIGLILLGVAATLSQTSVFGLFLLLFLAIALPILILDYRSRLGLVSLNLKGVALAPKRLGLFLLAVVGLGLIIFAAMPRLPGYQLRTFPVSAQVDVEGKFDGRQVINPGYVSGGVKTGSGNIGGEGQGFQPKFDPNYYYGFNSQIDQNLRGQLIPKIVLRVRSQAEGFWRVLAFDRYTGQGWKISRDEQVEQLNRSSWSYQFRLPSSSAIARSKEIVQTYTVVSDLPNLLPALTQPKELYFPTRQVALGPEGDLRSPIGLPEGLTYTVVSDVPYRQQDLLGRSGRDYPAAIRHAYLQVPPELVTKIRQQAQALLANAPRDLTSPYEQSLYLAQALKQKYTVQPNVPPLNKSEDLVEAFLFRFQGGYPDHFSTALTIMLRSLGIPARLVTGFGSGNFNPLTGLYIVRNTDAYAMTEVYFPKYGWFTFDPIPGHELIPPSVEVDQTFGVMRQFWQWIAGWLPSPVTGLLVSIFTTLATWLARLLHFFSQGWSGLFVGLLIVISLSFLGWLAWGQWQAWRYRRWLSRLPAMESLYQQMLNWVAQRGIRKRSAQTPLEHAAQVRQTQRANGEQVIEDIAQAYTSWRYGGHNPNLNQLRKQFLNLKASRTKKR